MGSVVNDGDQSRLKSDLCRFWREASPEPNEVRFGGESDGKSGLPGKVSGGTPTTSGGRIGDDTADRSGRGRAELDKEIRGVWHSQAKRTGFNPGVRQIGEEPMQAAFVGRRAD